MNSDCTAIGAAEVRLVVGPNASEIRHNKVNLIIDEAIKATVVFTAAVIRWFRCCRGSDCPEPGQNSVEKENQQLKVSFGRARLTSKKEGLMTSGEATSPIKALSSMTISGFVSVSTSTISAIRPTA